MSEARQNRFLPFLYLYLTSCRPGGLGVVELRRRLVQHGTHHARSIAEWIHKPLITCHTDHIRRITRLVSQIVSLPGPIRLLSGTRSQLLAFVTRLGTLHRSLSTRYKSLSSSFPKKPLITPEISLITTSTSLLGIQQTTAVPLTATISIPLFVPSTS